MASTDRLHIANLFSLEGYVCLVTGGGTGIGLMAAQALAANGAKVYITGRRLEVLEKAAKEHDPTTQSDPELTGQIIPLGPCDVRSKADLEKLVKDIESRESYLSLLVAAAGIPGPKESHPESTSATEIKTNLWPETTQSWNETFDTDVTAVYFSTLAMLPLLQAAPEHHSASAITISSMSGMMRHSQSHFAYNAAKAATAHLSKMMSREFSKVGVRVNSIAPGYFPSEMTMKASDDRNKAHMPDAKVQDKGHDVPAGRAGRDEEMGMAVVFLARCAYVNGQVLAVDGGVLNEVGGS